MGAMCICVTTASSKEDSTPNSPSKMKIVRKKRADDRMWKMAFDKWQEGTGPKPGPHPDPKSPYNTHPELFDIE